MRILLLGLNYAPEPIGTARYTAGLVDALSARGHEVRAVVGQPYYPDWAPWPGFAGWLIERLGTTEIYRVPHRIPARPTGRGRLVQQLTFALASLPRMLESAMVWRPDRVIAVAPSLLAAPIGLLAARLCGAQSWLHLQDFELEAAFATGLVARKRALMAVLRRVEQRVLQSFDHVSSISPAMCRRLADKGVAPERISEHRNWADLEAVRPLDRPSRFRQLLGITTPHVALYSGAMGRKQGLEVVVEAARLCADRRDLTFVICGNGPHRPVLEAAAEGLPNIRFHDLQPADQLAELLGLASVHLLPQIAEAADLVLPSKLPNMLASGRPVVATAKAGTGLFNEIEGCGLAVEPGDATALAAAISRLCDDPMLAQGLGAAARRRAETRWSSGAILTGFVAAIEGRAKAGATLQALAGERP